MLRKLGFGIFLLATPFLFAQNEANIWYFGQNAGLDFNTGSPVALTDGELNTFEGCASISDKDGNLLFYTDGRTVYNKNHNTMLNGMFLKGSDSSTQSALIVPRPNSSDMYYIFTVDFQGGLEGIQFSEVDMLLDGGLGGVTSNKNIKLYAPVNEKITAIKGCNGDCVWVVTHKINSSEFLAYKVTGAGVDQIPVVSNAGSNVLGSSYAIGAIKISPKGDKLAVANYNQDVQVFDFNLATGVVSNPLTLLNDAINNSYYGIEFSPNGNLLYVSMEYGGIYQFDLNAGTTSDILNSITEISPNPLGYGALQLAIDGKIYVSQPGIGYLHVINNPNELGLSCNYQEDAVYLQGKRAQMGLPPFIQSFFKLENILVEDTCFGNITTFELQDTVDSVVWDFGDPTTGVSNTSTDIQPTHVFSAPGTYEVSATATVGTNTATESITVIIYELPTISPQVNLKQCDDDQDGFSPFNLNEVIPEITASITDIVTFFETQLDAENNSNPITNTMDYINQTVSSDTVWARVENENDCFRISEVGLVVTTTLIPDNFTRDFYVCDDDLDGISTFDFSSIHEEIEAMFPTGQKLVIGYYMNEADALAESNQITDISNYQNIGYPNSQQIYVRVDSELDNDCLGLGAHINLHLEPMPVANPVTIERQCDDDNDGMFPFDVSQVEADVLSEQSLNDVTVSYFDESNNPLTSPLPNPFLTQSQTITIRVSNNRVTDGSCYAETSLEFIVDAQPVANPVPNQIACDDGLDDTDGIHEFDTTSIESTVLNGQTGMEVHYFAENGVELPSPLPNSFSTSSQSMEVRVINPLNPVCYASTTFDFIVNPLPEFSIETTQIVCSSDPTFTVLLDPIEENTAEVFDYEWMYEDGTVLSNDATLTVSTPGTYSITLTKTDGTECARTREVFVNASESPNITQENITVVDISNNNSISINTLNLGQGDYEFSLDTEFSNYQDNPYFDNVDAGIHTLFVRDKKGCGTSSIDISVIGYPKYFTPNGDGTNDFWQIKGVNGLFQSNSDIFIYDRYGKLLKQLATNSQGWDGTFNGRMLPTDDYWFSVTLEDGRIYKGHFALKR